VTIAKLWRKLMTEKLGYERFGAQGGDWGQAVTIQLALQFPESLIGIHLNGTGARPLLEAEQTEEERAWVRQSAAYRQAELDYFGEQSRKPQMPVFLPPSRFLQQDFNLIHYTQMPRGGHFACLEQPQLFVEDVRAFFRKIRT
jgi:pimeloyl-ACP methyl ester carboxylesterase